MMASGHRVLPRCPSPCHFLNQQIVLEILSLPSSPSPCYFWLVMSLHLPGHMHNWASGSLGSGLKCSDAAHLRSYWKPREYLLRHCSLFSLLLVCPEEGTQLRARGHRYQWYCPCTPASWVERRVEKAQSSSGGTSGRYAAHLHVSWGSTLLPRGLLWGMGIGQGLGQISRAPKSAHLCVLVCPCMCMYTGLVSAKVS